MADGPARQRLGQREQRLERTLTVSDHEDRALRRSAAFELQGRILPQNRALELLERRARVDAQLVDERPARILVCLERFGLSSGAVEGEHQMSAEALAQRVLADETAQLRDQLRVTTQHKVRLNPLLERGQAQVFEP